MPNLLAQIGQQIIKIGNRLVGRRIMTAAGQFFSLTVPEVFSAINQRNAIEEGFNRNIAVYVVVKKDAQKFGNITRYIFDATKKEEKASVKSLRRKYPVLEIKANQKVEVKPGENSPMGQLNTLLNRPNKLQSQDAFFTLLRAAYKVCGEGFVWLNRGDISSYINPDGSFDDMAIDRLPVLEMYVLPPQYITLIPDPENIWGVLGYILEVGDRVIMRGGDVIHWKDINLSFDASSREHSRGMSPLTPGARNLDEFNAIINGSYRTAINDGAKAVIYNETMNAMTPQQQADIKRVVDAKINNQEVAGAVAAIQGKWGLLNLATDARAMQMIERKKFSWHEIALLFGVPPEYVVTDTKYDNMGAAAFQWVSDSIIPACKQLDGEMNRVLLKAFGLDGIAFIGTDYSELPEVQAYMVKVAKELQEIWSITPNEIRELLGYEEREEEEFNEPWPVGTRHPMSETKAQAEFDQAFEMETMRIQNGYTGNGNGQVPKNSVGAKL